MSERYKSISQMHEMTGVSVREIKKRLSHLSIQQTKGKAQLYDMFEAFKFLPNEQIVGDLNIDQQLRVEQLRLEKAKADKIELEVAKIKSELVPIEDVATLVEREYGAVRAGLISMPSKISQDLVLMDQFITIKNFLEDAINEVLTELTADTSFNEASDDLGESNPEGACENNPDKERTRDQG